MKYTKSVKKAFLESWTVSEFRKNFPAVEAKKINCTKKQLIEDYKKTIKKRENRQNLLSKEPEHFYNIHDKVNFPFWKRAMKKIVENLYFKKYAHIDNITFELNDKPEIIITKNRYVRYSRYGNWHYNYVYKFNPFKITKPKFYSCDGIINLSMKKIRTIDNRIDVYNAIILEQGRSYNNIRLSKCIIAHIVVNNIDYFYHADTIKKAVIGLQNKISKKNIKQISLNSEITRTMYKKITGACSYGVNSFCDKYDLSNKKSIKIKDLLPLLEKEQAFGLDKIKNAIV